MLRFAEELLVLLLNEQDGDFSHLSARSLDFALTGAVLMDLAFEGRIDTDAEALILTDPTPVGDDLLDPILADIVAAWDDLDPQPPEFWLRRFMAQADALRTQALRRLVNRGILDTDDTHTLFSLSHRVARTRRYMTVDGQYERQIHDRIMDIIFSEDIPAPSDVVCIALAHACGFFQRILTGPEYEEVQDRITLIAGLDLIGQAIPNAIRKLNVADTQALRRVIHKQGGGWPQVSGAWPVAGHAFKLAGNIGAYLTEQYLKHGPVFEIRVFGHRYVVLAGRDANRFMIREGRSYLRSWEHWRGFNDELGSPHIITALDGPEHSRLRKTLRAGYSQRTFLQYIPEAVTIVEREVAQLGLEQPVSGYRVMQRITTEQICRITTGASAMEYLDDAILFINMLEKVYLTRRRPRIMMSLPRVRRARKRLETAFEEILVAHMPERRLRADHDLVDDLLDLHAHAPEFLPSTDLFINVIGPFLLGLDTVAGSATFMLYSLLKDRDLLELARAEADELFADGMPTAEDIRRLPVIHGTVLETLRMYPIAPALTRTAMNSFEFGGYHIPAGTDLIMATTVPHNLPEFFPFPERFDIDRYTPERKEHAQLGAFAPFGLGHHACLGQGFALAQMVLNMATLLNRTEIAMDPPSYQLKIAYTPVAHPDHRFKFQILGHRHGIVAKRGGGAPWRCLSNA